MTKKAKTAVFFLACAIFLAAAPSVVFYTQGYRVNFAKKQIVQTGGLSVKAWPHQAQVYINGKEKKKTDVFFGQTFIGNLLPETYSVRVSKEGYSDWQKELDIKEKRVTTAQNIILFPQDFHFRQFAAQIKNGWLSPDGKKIAVWKSEAGKQIIGVIDLATGISQDFDTANLIGRNISPQDLIWSNDGKRFLLGGASDGVTSWGMADLTRRDNPEIRLNFLSKSALDVNFHPAAAEKLFVSVKSGKTYNIFEADLNGKTAAKSPLLQNTAAFGALGGSLFWLDANGYLIQGDLSGNPRNTLNQNPLQLNQDVGHILFLLNPQKLFLLEDKTLFYLNPASRNFEKISASADEFSFSPDGRKAAYVNNTELWIIYLETQEDQPREKIGERVFLTRLSKKISQLTWVNSFYLAFLSDGELKIAETDSRDGVNMLDMIAPLSSAPSGQNSEKLFFSLGDKKLYILKDESLYSSGKQLTN